MAPSWTKEGALWPHPQMTFQFLEDPVEERNRKNFTYDQIILCGYWADIQVKALPESAQACFLVPVPLLQAVFDQVWI